MSRATKTTSILSLLTAVILVTLSRLDGARPGDEASAATTASRAPADTPPVLHKAVKVGDLEIFYREAGPSDAPAVLLLHGFPTSSQMFRNLIPKLADSYRVVAPDYPGYGHSSMPPRDQFAYTFDNLAKVVDEFTD